MRKVAFRMRLHKGKENEYKIRHDNIPRELTQLLKSAGISDYSIFLDDVSGDLFGVMSVQDKTKIGLLPQHPVMQQWWKFMKDIMDTNDDNSPVSTNLEEVFHMD